MGDAPGLIGAICLIVLIMAGALGRRHGRLQDLKRENDSMAAYIKVLEIRNAALLDGLRAATEGAGLRSRKTAPEEFPDEGFMGWCPPPEEPGPDPRAQARDLFGLGPDEALTPERLKAAYRSAVKKAHPDNGGDADAFMAVQDAYELLGGRV